MTINHACVGVALCGSLTCLMIAGSSFPGTGRETNAPERHQESVIIYDRQVDHLWNRLHQALFVRVGPDGRAYGHDRLEPLLWPGSKHLLAGPSHDRAIKLLNEFIEKQGEKSIEDPLKRAVLQRDLWMVFNWLESSHPRKGDSGLREEQLRESRPRLRRLLAAVIRRLALSPEQIKKLPDNYAAAAASGRFAKSYASEQADKPYLPPDLFAADGPWICVGRRDTPVAREHLGEANPFTNSTFFVFLRLPGGRDAALKYLKQGADALPAGTEVALVRRTLLIASPGEVTATNLTESIQLRVYGESGQSFSEFRLSRNMLFAGQGDGLRAVGSDERDFKTGFASGAWDEFEEPLVGQPLDIRQVWIKGECRGCHAPDRFPGLRAADRPKSLLEVSPTEAMATGVKWKRKRPDWATLRRLLTE